MVSWFISGIQHSVTLCECVALAELTRRAVIFLLHVLDFTQPPGREKHVVMVFADTMVQLIRLADDPVCTIVPTKHNEGSQPTGRLGYK